MLLSGNIGEGCLCSWRGGKLIRAGRRMKVAGVWTSGTYTKVLTLNDKLVEVIVPAGLVVKGNVQIRTSSNI